MTIGTSLPGVIEIGPERQRDARGWFATLWRAADGLLSEPAELCQSWNERRGTLRGIHWQEPPQAKLVWCLQGAIWDVAFDVRTGQWIGRTLSAENGRALLVPAGCGHGFQTLENGTLVAYLIAGVYQPEKARGVRWNDPRLRILWPIGTPVLSERDAAWPDWLPA